MKAKRLLIGLVLAVMPIVTMADGKLSNKPLPDFDIFNHTLL
mgnify:CR=1 FL=1